MGNQCCRESDEKQKQSGFVSIDDGSHSNSSINPSTILSTGTNNTLITKNISSSNNTPGGPNNNNNNTNGGENFHNNLQSIDAKRAEEQAAEREERQRALQQEQNRLEEIVALAGRDMVPLVNRGGGSMSSLNSRGSLGNNNAINFGHGGAGGYYDPSYANLIMQDLSRTFMEYNQKLAQEEMASGSGSSSTVGRILKTQREYWQIPQTSIKDGRDAIDVLCSNSNSRRIIENKNDLEDMAETFVASVFCTKEGLLKDIGPIVENVFSG